MKSDLLTRKLLNIWKLLNFIHLAQENDLFATPRPVTGNIDVVKAFFGVVAVRKETPLATLV
ncbi:MAG: hypothetical protein R3B93_09165 [Bacteroidia bacterium]